MKISLQENSLLKLSTILKTNNIHTYLLGCTASHFSRCLSSTWICLFINSDPCKRLMLMSITLGDFHTMWMGCVTDILHMLSATIFKFTYQLLLLMSLQASAVKFTMSFEYLPKNWLCRLPNTTWWATV